MRPNLDGVMDVSPEGRHTGGPEVECSAVNCIYNEDRMCEANELKIIGEKSKAPNQTECITFNPE
jgi:hypothetical protein